jgi:UDP:flavonoid glycosyltransferase YjiC (YdhE family)
LLSKAVDIYSPLESLRHPVDVVVYINRGTRPVEVYLSEIAGLARKHPELQFCVVEKRETRVSLPLNMLVVEAAPIGRLLASAKMLISGGGQNAILAALQAGTPVLGVQGLSAERDFNIRRAVALGAARMYALGETPGNLEMHFDALMSDPSYSSSSAVLARDLCALPGPAGAANSLINLSLEAAD